MWGTLRRRLASMGTERRVGGKGGGGGSLNATRWYQRCDQAAGAEEQRSAGSSGSTPGCSDRRSPPARDPAR